MMRNHLTFWITMCLGMALNEESPRQDLPARCNPCEVRFDVALSKPTYEVGEPIILRLSLTNLGSSTVGISRTSDVTGRHDGYELEVIDANGQRMPDPGAAAISLLKSLGSLMSIPPKGEFTRELMLNYRVAPLEPGHYRVKGFFAPGYPNGDVRVESGVVSFEIVDTPLKNLQKRISDLLEGVDLRADGPKVAPLLGFTGHASALPALIDILYAESDGAQAAAVDALLYLDRERVRDSLIKSLQARGPRDRMVHVLVVTLRADETEVRPALLRWLSAGSGTIRAAAVEGLRLGNRARDPALFRPLVAMLRDPVATVRHHAANAVGEYQDAAALDALKTVLDDSDPAVSTQATIAVGWVALAAQSESATRKEATEVLRRVQRSQGRAGQQATYWLARIDDK